MVRSGTIRVGQQLYLGPDTHERFTLVNVRSLYLNRVAVTEVYSGQICTLGIKTVISKEQLNRKTFRKGIVLLEKSLNPVGYKYILAEIEVLHHSTTIKKGY